MYRSLPLHQIAVAAMAASAHIIICGYGRSGKALATFLAQENIDFIALDLGPAPGEEAAMEGKRVVYGDAAKREVLLAAGFMRAKTLVVSYDDKHSALRILQQCERNTS